MQNAKLKFKIQKCLMVIVLVFVATPVFAVNLFFGAKTNEVGVGQQFEVKIFVNTSEESVNAFEGKITFPSDLVKLKDIRDGNSIINFWIEKPKAENNAIVFSGITPGGFQGDNGLLLSAIFEAKAEGIARFEINGARVLRNDGTGSPAVLTTTPFEMTISKKISAKTPSITEIQDTEPPESFVPEIAKHKTLFDGKWFLVFATQDKGSGIDHYEILESRIKNYELKIGKWKLPLKKWKVAESPYLLKDQKLKSYIYVKAVDKAGNERIAMVEPKFPRKWYENWWIWVIIIIIGAYIVWRKLRVKNERRKITI